MVSIGELRVCVHDAIRVHPSPTCSQPTHNVILPYLRCVCPAQVLAKRRFCYSDNLCAHRFPELVNLRKVRFRKGRGTIAVVDSGHDHDVRKSALLPKGALRLPKHSSRVGPHDSKVGPRCPRLLAKHLDRGAVRRDAVSHDQAARHGSRMCLPSCRLCATEQHSAGEKREHKFWEKAHVRECSKECARSKAVQCGSFPEGAGHRELRRTARVNAASTGHPASSRRAIVARCIPVRSAQAQRGRHSLLNVINRLFLLFRACSRLVAQRTLPGTYPRELSIRSSW